MHNALIRSLALTLLFASPAVTQAQDYRARVRLPAFAAVLALDTMTIRLEIPASRGEVFHVAAAAMEQEFKIELRMRDSLSGVVGNLELVKMRTLGRSPMSRYVSCGSGMTGPNADSYRIYLAVAAFVDSIGPGKTMLGVSLAAAAQDLQGSSKAPLQCGSTGVFENQIRRVVGARFGTAVR